jgi:hypothetical protein
MYKVALSILALASASAASAGINLNFNSASGNLGNSHNYTVTGLPPADTVMATGYSANGTQAALFGKNGSGDEKGLGLVGDPTGDDEIYYPGSDFIQIDVHNLFGIVTGASFFMGSSTGGETWKVYASNTAGQLGSTLIASGNDELFHALTNWGQYSYYDFVATGTVNQAGYRSAGNVLLGGLLLTPAPEPSTWALMLIGFAGVGMALRRKTKLALPQVA